MKDNVKPPYKVLAAHVPDAGIGNFRRHRSQPEPPSRVFHKDYMLALPCSPTHKGSETQISGVGGGFRRLMSGSRQRQGREAPQTGVRQRAMARPAPPQRREAPLARQERPRPTVQLLQRMMTPTTTSNLRGISKPPDGSWSPP